MKCLFALYMFSRMPRPVAVSGFSFFFSLHVIIQPPDVRTFIVLMQRCSQLLSMHSFDVPERCVRSCAGYFLYIFFYACVHKAPVA